MQDKFYKITLALAGLIQSVSLVKEIAQTGKANDAAYQASINSIFQTNPNNILEIYEGLPGIKLGLEKLLQIFGPQVKSSKSLMHYVLSLLYLQKKISRSTKLQNQLIQRIQQAKKQVDYFHLTHPTVISNLADTYLNTISPFKFRIIIWGTERSLSVTENMDKIRALLLSGIRSAVLWRQMGGSRLQLIFSRGKIKAMAEKILEEIEQKS